ncbi:arsinothricin resistance N-acetyltransferase ArsN1 family B [Undibacterium sp.]|jgi:L-amino acid N-acyltransferase YncA|uniref:arsinothricin resistance N-acetyltransferase ArsN1 family B n=1 Tax=Undibacterium sp. TaxID=1914977 RepID=UPI002CFBADC6|nr:arsinothricin resistance N-acetyltransferase ArsN1 family B [Undibacterium sp.]HTD05937.1 arsinothricin resistance N-acetyltransferase ArsN1 family B [Undibacterium sp.]
MPNLRAACLSDAEGICSIYNHYVLNTSISFEETEVLPDEMSRRIVDVTQHLPWLVIENEDGIAGYAYASKWRTRSAYRFSVETSVYLAQSARGHGFGVRLYEALLRELDQLGVHAAIGGIAQPNEASVKLHEKLGFRKVAMFEQVGFKNGQWVDVGYWQKLL